MFIDVDRYTRYTAWWVQALRKLRESLHGEWPATACFHTRDGLFVSDGLSV